MLRETSVRGARMEHTIATLTTLMDVPLVSALVDPASAPLPEALLDPSYRQISRQCRTLIILQVYYLAGRVKILSSTFHLALLQSWSSLGHLKATTFTPTISYSR